MGKVRTIRDADGKMLNKVHPGYPAEIDGWKDIPTPGDQILEVETEKQAREVTALREELLEQEKAQKDMEIINDKREQHQQVYKELLEKKRRMGRFKLKREGPRKPEIEEGEVSGFLLRYSNLFCIYRRPEPHLKRNR